MTNLYISSRVQASQSSGGTLRATFVAAGRPHLHTACMRCDPSPNNTQTSHTHSLNCVVLPLLVQKVDRRDRHNPFEINCHPYIYARTCCDECLGICQIWSSYLHPLRQHERQRQMYKMWWFWCYGSLKVIGNVTIWYRAYDFLFDFNKYSASIFYHFRVTASYLSKVAHFNLWYLHLLSQLGVTPFEFCRDL